MKQATIKITFTNDNGEISVSQKFSPSLRTSDTEMDSLVLEERQLQHAMKNLMDAINNELNRE